MSLEAIDRELSSVKEMARAPRLMMLGCYSISHDRLEFCAHCVPAHRSGGLDGQDMELMGWRLLALRDKERDGEEARQWCAQHCVGVFAPPLHRHSCPRGRD